MNNSKSVLASALFAISIVPCLLGQGTTEGSILGVVTDASSGLVPGATVLVTSLETGVRRTGRSDSNGSFEILSVPRGRYTVAINAAGFKSWQLAEIPVNSGERKRISPRLQVGDVAERVEVAAQADLLQTEKGSVETTVDQQIIRNIPLNGRNPVELVSLAPGMRYVGRTANQERGFDVQGNGVRQQQTDFQLDGLNSNGAQDERGQNIPNVDAIAEFNVQTNSFGAESGRLPMQVLVTTKSGTNDFHGTAWEFHRNSAVDARNAFASIVPKLVRNQFGVTAGGQIIENRLFYFGSFEGTRIREATVFNSFVPRNEMYSGDFSALSRTVRDPLTNSPFPGNQIPTSRISAASRFFFPNFVRANTGADLYRDQGGSQNNVNEYTMRFDYNMSDTQRLFVRWVIRDEDALVPQYRPEVTQTTTWLQHNIALNYSRILSPTTLFSIGGNLLYHSTRYTSPVAGTSNLAEQAGIQGFPTEGREDFVGLPSVAVTGYTAFNAPFGVPGRNWNQTWGGKTSLTTVRGKHTISLGYEFNERNALARHGSFASRGNFTFNGQYTGDAFADYLLGYVAAAGRNYPLQTCGTQSAPYSGLYVQDSWRLSSRLTLNYGVRWDHWNERRFVRGNGATFEPTLGKAIAAETRDGQVDLTAQPVARFLAAATQGLWIPASQADIPAGLAAATGLVSPRLGVAWRPFASSNIVVRGGYGIYPSTYNNNNHSSSIVGPPYWAFENPSFSAASLTRWETAFPQEPTSFGPPSILAPKWNADLSRIHQFNVAVQMPLPLQSALTVSYVGNRGVDLLEFNPVFNTPPVGRYTNLQAARPFPLFGPIELRENWASSWYNSLQVKLEKRFSNGLLYQGAYAFGRFEDENASSRIPYAPAGYNKGRSTLDRTHTLVLTGIYEVPLGRGRRYGSSMNRLLDAIVGGWQLSGLGSFTSGAPLALVVPGATLGNGYGTRPDITGEPGVSGRSARSWFNPAALSAPAALAFGNSKIGDIDGPSETVLNTGLMKNFRIFEGLTFQTRWELFNATNHVNLGTPVTTIGLANTGQILSAGPARSMQFAGKLIW
ncbi:MAG: TonB-dependent receptor [Bryobacteraceae bacterium]|nr:TonB-dependent receptor [Bryobacteraceae bacterium]